MLISDWSSDVCSSDLVAGDYNRTNVLLARKRSYTQTIDGSTSLIPEQRQVSAVLSGHQDLSSALTFELDGQYSRRTSDMSFPSTTTANARTNGALFQMKVASWSVTPTMKLQLPRDWRRSEERRVGKAWGDQGRY